MKIIRTSNGVSVKVDDWWFPFLSMFTWNVSLRKHATYARISGPRMNGPQTLIRMHRVITSCPTGLYVDHINHDTLDNQESNLRICTKQENCRNRKNSAGVTFNQGRWVAWIKTEGRQKVLGRFLSREEAIKARRIAETETYGAFAPVKSEVAP